MCIYGWTGYLMSNNTRSILINFAKFWMLRTQNSASVPSARSHSLSLMISMSSPIFIFKYGYKMTEKLPLYLFTSQNITCEEIAGPWTRPLTQYLKFEM